jgi:hypothetical protein
MDRGRTNAGGAKVLFLVTVNGTTESRVLSKHRTVFHDASKYAFLERGKSGAAAYVWSRYIHNFVECDTLNQDDAIRQTYGFGNIMGDEHCGKAAALPDVLDELLHFDARERVEGAQRFVQKQQIRVMDKSSRKCHPLTLPAR